MIFTPAHCLEILNALIQKGLRPISLPGWRVGVRNTECPDSKGIKTGNIIVMALLAEILNALIQKGLRR